MSPNGMELNKIAAAVLLAGLIGMVAGKASEFLYYGGPQHHGADHKEKRGFSVEVTEVTAGGGAAAPTGPADLAPLYASADIEAGKVFFSKKCATCHNVDKGGANGVGPNLYGVVGRKIASHGGFSYSQALKDKASESWDFDHINHWLWNPRKYAPGNIMAFAGVPKDQERANLIAYLNSMSDNKLPYPEAKPVETPEAAAADENIAGGAAKEDAQAKEAEAKKAE